jgi:NAD(P)-dependent dehydrogenase (short-subunit alcohol dehydrogenase family)
MELEDKTALITGSGARGGIGGETARLFAREGASVVITGRNAADGEQVVREITEAGGRARFVQADLTDLGAVRRLAEEAGQLDILVNNAAAITLGATTDQTIEGIEESLATNLRAPFVLTAAVVPGMLARGAGSIVNVSSMAARIGMPGMAVYGATKAAFESLTRTWAAEFGGRGIRVNAVAPGPTGSEKVRGTMGEAVEALAQQSPLSRVASTSEIAQAILFLASDRSSYVTGAILAADGGRTAV